MPKSGKNAPKQKPDIRPAGKGGASQQAGGPDHKGEDAHKDKNP